MEKELISLLKEYASEHGSGILEINTDLDHVHLLTGCSPQHCLPDRMKSLSARFLFKKFPELKEKLRNPGYFVSTVSDPPEKYIQSQKEK